MPRNRQHNSDHTPPKSSQRTSSTESTDSPPPKAGSFPIVGIGASAGGLDAFRKLVDALPADNGMALVLIQHLDPTHESMMVDLLASHTPMTVRQAIDGMPIEPGHIYVIPPGAYLTVRNGALHLSRPQERHGARLPFDYFLHSLAEDCGPRAVCVILSGTGADGSAGLKAVKEQGGFVIAQDPEEAAFDGMPRSAIMTGAVDLVLPVAEIPAALVERRTRPAVTSESDDRPPAWLSKIVELLRTKTPHNFTLYKPGTLQRRIERRMAMVGLPAGEMDRYLDILRRDSGELDLLAKDLLINVTAFFRDSNVYDYLAEKIIPDLVRGAVPDRPLRIWIAGCSTGEETYSLAMLFLERIAAEKRNVKLQVFASDVDPDAVVSAREGLYPATIEKDLSEERLARFFTKEDHGYRVLPELRSVVVFTVQDVLADPPFSRLDLVSCRNLLIYLRPEAQARVVTLFHFALREGGILLLGNSESAGAIEGRFEVISRSMRLYRHIGRSRPGDLASALVGSDAPQVSARPRVGLPLSRQAVLADLCRRLVMETFAPAAVLINRKHECLFSLGPTDRYLHVAPGYPTNDLLAMAHRDVRTKLRSAIQQATHENARVVITGARMKKGDSWASFSIDVQPVLSEGEELFLVCFVDEPPPAPKQDLPISPRDAARVAELEQELEATRLELQGAIHNLEVSSEEQKAINEEALSVNEEFQSTNEELLTSKEELQSLNEELTALNSQLQETLERQRTTANDLQNILYSTDVATLFLDTNLDIRFFTPATKSLFNVIPGDVGRPLSDLNALADDSALMDDARSVLHSAAPIEREVQARNDVWYIRRILPYRTQDNGVEGVVITFTDITERRMAEKALEEAKRQAEMANVAKSRFLAAASHDLRQPLQTLSLLQGLLAKMVEGKPAKKFVSLLDQTLGAMSGMLNTLLDINEIDAGTVHAEKVDFPIDDLLGRLRDEFIYHAQGHGLALRTVPCALSVHSDPRLLEQMVRNLLANALKYTRRGKVLLGCRRHADSVLIEIWDTGVGIPADKLQTIFEEYQQLDNAARERSRGLGLGLSIVQRLGSLLGHPIHVRSHQGKGSVFSIEVALASGAASQPSGRREALDAGTAGSIRRTGAILVIEDDPEVRELLELALEGEGHRVETAPDGPAALEMVMQGGVQPDLILADYNLPNDMDGLQVAAKLRERFHREVPVVILTGDISTGTLSDIARQNCVQLTKPVKSNELTAIIQQQLPASLPLAPAAADAPRPATASGAPGSPVIFVVDDDSHVRESIRGVLEGEGRTVEDYATCEDFLDAYRPGREGCLLVDAYLPGMNGIELLQRLKDAGHSLPAIMITGSSDVPMAVQAMKAGASDFIEKPIGRSELLAGVERALEQSRDTTKRAAWRNEAATRIARLTPRQREVMELVLAGHPTKNIAADLQISERTVESHRAEIMKRTGTRSLPALARLALAAASTGADDMAPVLRNPPPHHGSSANDR